MSNNIIGNNFQIIFDTYDETIQYLYEINKNDYIATALISTDTRGPVSCFYKTGMNVLCTIKKIAFFDNPNEIKNLLEEISILKFINHPNIIKLLDIYIPDRPNFDSIYLIEEYMDTNLEKLIVSSIYDYKKDVKFIPWIIYQILQGINYLHSSKIIHRNIRPQNILLDEKGNIKICGFGKAISFDNYENTSKGDTNEFVSEKCNLLYTAPEILGSKKKDKKSYDEKVDLWSVGCIMAELYTKIIPFFPMIRVNKKKWISQLNGIFSKLGKPSEEKIRSIFSKERFKQILKFYNFEKIEKNELFPDVKDENAIDLMVKLLTIDPKERITLKDAIHHPYFDILKEYKNDDDFEVSNVFYTSQFKKEIEEMEKRKAFFNEQIQFYKGEILKFKNLS